MRARNRADEDPVLAELRQIKALWILLLLKVGADSFEIARVTKVGSSTIRRDFSAAKIAAFGSTKRTKG